MKKKIKWLVPVFLVLLFIFAPFPVPHFDTFTDVYNYEGEIENVIIKVRFFHFKPLFLDYGDEHRAYYSLGYVDVYDNSTDEKICTLKLDFYVSKHPKIDDIYFTALYQYNKKEFAEYSGYLIWDDGCQNILLPLQTRLEKIGEVSSTTYKDITYFSSNAGLDVSELEKLFYKFDSFILPSSTETKYESPTP